MLYLIVGETHPVVRRRDGEGYRRSLLGLARLLGVEAHVRFHDHFVTAPELREFVGAADICLTPYRNRDYPTSGPLSYAIGVGTATISTRYWYAEELLGDGAGILVPFQDPAAIAAHTIRLLANDQERLALGRRAYDLGRGMTWPAVARRQMESFGRALQLPATATTAAVEVPALRH